MLCLAFGQITVRSSEQQLFKTIAMNLERINFLLYFNKNKCFTCKTKNFLPLILLE